MEVRRFDDIDAFAARAVPHLAAHEAESNLELGIIAAIQAGRFADAAPLLLSVEAAGEVLGVAMRTPPFGLLLSSLLPPAAVAAVATWLRASDDPAAAIPGVQGEVSVAAAFVEAWHRIAGPRMAVHREERIYRLTAVRPPTPLPAGTLREVRADDLALIVDWFAAFAVDTNDPDPIDPAVAAGRVISAGSPDFGLAIWDVDDTPRSMAGYGGPTAHGIRVGPVYTPPEQRRRGYAGALVAALSQHLLDGGRQFCFLFTDLSNPTSNHVYQQLGYEPVSDVTQWRLIEG
ncbi:MAG: GNAT family N-acetyltransferase [Chloroflexi bacterium]|nr:GNAT family N-acetyltransferase [Chloroflexota bacterium]MDA1146362.1 GNAT family N-acetyltransferase [Chloroflexota bacterium]